jgi:hypothetical protein
MIRLNKGGRKMKKCKSCQSEIDSKAKKCPNCGKKQGMPIWLIVIIVILILGVVGAIIGGGESESDKKEEPKTGTTTEKKEKLTLEDGHSGSLDEYGAFYYIEGYVKNDSDKEYNYVQIEFTSYDSEGNILGTCVDNASGLEANGRWKFKASCLDDTKNIASYKLKEITGY